MKKSMSGTPPPAPGVRIQLPPGAPPNPPPPADDEERAGDDDDREVLPAAGNGLRMPYPANPGTITCEILRRSAGRQPAKIARALAAAYEEFDEEPDPDVVLNKTLGTDELTCFLTVAPDSPRIMLVRSLARFNVSFGAVNEFHGRVFGRVGEFIDGQMPRLWRAPQEDTGATLFETSRPKVSNDALEAHYGAHETLLAPWAGEVAADAEPGTYVILCRLAYVPMEWAPYFLDPMTPWQAIKTIGTLRDTLPEGDRHIADPLLNWAQLAATRRRTSGRGSVISRMAIPWQPVNPDRKLVRWAARQMRNIVAESAPPPITLDPQECYNKACETLAAVRTTGGGGGGVQEVHSGRVVNASRGGGSGRRRRPARRTC